MPNPLFEGVDAAETTFETSAGGAVESMPRAVAPALLSCPKPVAEVSYIVLLRA